MCNTCTIFYARTTGDGGKAVSVTRIATVKDAVAAVRALPHHVRVRGVNVTLAGGDYLGPDNQLLLGAADSGVQGAPIVYRADPTDPQPVRLHGAAAVCRVRSRYRPIVAWQLTASAITDYTWRERSVECRCLPCSCCSGISFV